MIEVYKITHNIYDPDASLKLAYHSDSITRGNKYKLSHHKFHYDLRKYYFSARIVNTWNNLPNHVVDINTINLFKTRLDRFTTAWLICLRHFSCFRFFLLTWLLLKLGAYFGFRQRFRLNHCNNEYSRMNSLTGSKGGVLSPPVMSQPDDG